MWQPKTTLVVLVLAAISLRACTGTAEPSGKPLTAAVNFDPSTNLYTSPLNSGRPLLLDLSSTAILTPCSTPTSTNTKVTISAFETDGKKLLEQVSFPAPAFCAAPPSGGGVSGVAGLGPSPLSLSSQVASLQKIPNKFGLCLSRDPNSPGAAIFGGGPLFSPEVITTRLTRRPAEILDVTKIISPEIPLRLPPRAGALHQVSARNDGGIAVNGKLVAAAGAGQGRFPIDIGLSTTTPYTELRDDVYGPFRDAYERALGPKAVGAKVPPTAPFELCYDLKRLNVYVLPQVDFMLERGQNWTIADKADVSDMAHSGVQPVSGNNAACFPYVRMKQPSDGMPAVVIGGIHMANRVVVFDEDKQKFSFTPSFISDPPSLGCGHST